MCFPTPLHRTGSNDQGKLDQGPGQGAGSENSSRAVGPTNFNSGPSSSAPMLSAHGRNVIMRYTTRREVLHPQGIAVESIRMRINQTLSNSAKIRGSTPYIKMANIWAHVGCIFLFLANHSAWELGNRLDKAKLCLLRDLNIPELEFQMDIEKVKIFVTGVLLADTGVVTAAHPEIVGSIHGMRQGNACTCAIRFIVEKNEVVNEALRSEKIFLHCRARNVRVFSNNKAVKVWQMQVTEIEVRTISVPWIEDVTREADNEVDEASAPQPKSAKTKGKDPAKCSPSTSPSPCKGILKCATSGEPLLSIPILAFSHRLPIPAPICKVAPEYRIIDGDTEPIVDPDGLHVPIEADGRDLFCFVKGTGIDVFVRSHICGLFEVVGYRDGSAQIGYRVTGERGVVTGICFLPTHTKSVYLAWWTERKKLDTVLGDFNARHTDWDPNADHYNRPGRWLREWLMLHCYNLVPSNQTTFHDISVIDLCLHQSPYVKHRYLDIVRLDVNLLKDLIRRCLAWKKAD
ncbi:hypothetical protein HOY80DRAFT_1046329 [Tuber brumale]|nr:hypothetical protein HOY80DRAFT_1046329 [Tuber brumale]